MAKKVISRKLKRIINSYIIAQNEPLENVEDLYRYIRKKKISKVTKSQLESIIKNKLKREKEDDLKELEAKLFTKDGEPRKHRYGSAFCDNCYMYKDYEKECP
ncbi:MAG: hypothetical protein ACOCSL_05210, partial [Thermoplasmatota archaeon]